ncbi:MAG: 50S ribosomal protein L9 [bacterium]
MKIILTKDVPKVGRRFEILEVSDGYARNFILKNKLGEIATSEVINKMDAQKKKNEEARKQREKEVILKLESVASLGLSINAKVNKEGHLFAGIKKDDIYKLVTEKGVEIKDEELIFDKPIKEVGDYDIVVKIGEKNTKFKLSVVALE